MTFQYSGTTNAEDYDQNFKSFELQDITLLSFSNGTQTTWYGKLNTISSKIVTNYISSSQNINYEVYQ